MAVYGNGIYLPGPRQSSPAQSAAGTRGRRGGPGTTPLPYVDGCRASPAAALDAANVTIGGVGAAGLYQEAGGEEHGAEGEAGGAAMARCRTGPAAKPWPGVGDALMMDRATAEEERA